MPNKKMTLGDALRVARRPKTQAAIAAAIGVGKSAVANYETGQRLPKPEQVAAIAALTETPLETLTKAWIDTFRAMPRNARTLTLNPYCLHEPVTDDDLRALFKEKSL